MSVEVLIEKAVDREQGYLYFVDKQGNVCRTKMKRGNPGSRRKVKKSKKNK